MSQQKKLMIVITNGFDNERSSMAWGTANGAVASGFELTIFLVASGVDWVRKGATQVTQLNPLAPAVGTMMQNVIDSGATNMVCPSCAKVRGTTLTAEFRINSPLLIAQAAIALHR
jgi:predicted peroxiredoxin